MTMCTLTADPVHQHRMCDALDTCIFFASVIATKLAPSGILFHTIYKSIQKGDYHDVPATHVNVFANLQAFQTRKVPFVPAQFPGVSYDPDIHSSSTIAAGSAIQQVTAHSLHCHAEAKRCLHGEHPALSLCKQSIKALEPHCVPWQGSIVFGSTGTSTAFVAGLE